MSGPSPPGPSSSSGSAPTRRWQNPQYLLLPLILILHLALARPQAGDLVDDAYISARYARNLVQGYGLTYNRAPAGERVEGYSNFLWVLLLAAGQTAGQNPKVVSQTAGLLANLVCLFFCWLLIRRWSPASAQTRPGGYSAPAGALLLAVNLPLMLWAVSGLETSLFALEVLAAFFCFGDGRGRRWAAGGAALLAALTRPEGVLVAVSLVLARLVFLVRDRARPTRQDFHNLMVFLAPYLVYFGWRLVYYGDFLPNAAYAKVEFGGTAWREGMRYLWSAAKWGHLPLALFFGLGAYGLARRPPRELAAPLVFLGLYLMFILAVGGDWMPHFRFGVHLLPLAFSLAGLGLARLESRWPASAASTGARRLLAPAAILLGLGFSLFRYTAYEVKPSVDQTWHRRQAQFYTAVSRWVLQHVWQSESVAAGDIGYLGYISDVDRIVDTNGLVDRHLARRPGVAALSADLDYLLAQEPYCLVLMVHRYPGGEELGHSETDRALLADPRLPQKYRFRAEFFGWDNFELSRTDLKPRSSKVFFLVYTAKTARAEAD